MSLEQIVNVTITRQTKTVARASFSKILIVGSNPTFAERYKEYSTGDLSAVAADLTGGTAATEYTAAAAIAAQNPRVTTIALGRIDGGDADLTASLNAIENENDSWYGLILADRTLANQKLAADWAETNKKLFAAASADADILDAADTTSIAYYAKNSALARTTVVYHSLAASQYADAALLGKILPFTPGSYTAKFKTLAGITVDSLTVNQQSIIAGKNCNYYIEVGGVNIITEGKVGEPEWIDTIVLIDWTESRLKENVYSAMVNNLKIPYDDRGIGVVEGRMAQVFEEGIANGGFTQKQYDNDGNVIGGYEIRVPAAANVSATDKNNRELNNVEFTAWLAGAIHAANITGVVTV